MKMKSLILLIVGMSFMAMGCARSYVGSPFTGQITINQAGGMVGTAATPISAQINFTSDSGSQVQGTLTSQAGNANITGTATGGALSNIMLTVTGQSQMSMGGAMLMQNTTYTGSLSYTGDRLSGTLTQSGMSGMYGTTAGSLTIDVRR